MSRRPRPTEVSRSEHWLRVAVNEPAPMLNSRIGAAFGWSPDEDINWPSPVVTDEYSEYYGDSFVERLGLRNLRMPLNEFWPASGPRWDALGRATAEKLVLVEAKAHLSGIVDYGTRAGPESAAKIANALVSAKTAYRAAAEAPWHAPFYQHANRLAHLHYLRGAQRAGRISRVHSFRRCAGCPHSMLTRAVAGCNRDRRKEPRSAT
jgi:hypothetical protein